MCASMCVSVCVREMTRERLAYYLMQEPGQSDRSSHRCLPIYTVRNAARGRDNRTRLGHKDIHHSAVRDPVLGRVLRMPVSVCLT